VHQSLNSLNKKKKLQEIRFQAGQTINNRFDPLEGMEPWERDVP